MVAVVMVVEVVEMVMVVVVGRGAGGEWGGGRGRLLHCERHVHVCERW